jgi:hypothetical protein
VLFACSSEYKPPASQCQILTCAPVSGVQAPLLSTFWTLIVSCSGMPALTSPLDGSVVISERWSISSTK